MAAAQRFLSLHLFVILQSQVLLFWLPTAVAAATTCWCGPLQHKCTKAHRHVSKAHQQYQHRAAGLQGGV